MSSKDWKKISSNRSRGELYSWFNEKIKTYVTVFYLPYLYDKKQDYPYSVSVEQVDDRDIIEDDFDKKFSVKSTAIKFAKSYMRKH